MKKLFAKLLVLSLSTMISACGSETPPPDQQAQGTSLEDILAHPFTMDYEYSEEQIKSLTENDMFETIAQAGPLYIGEASYVQPGLKKFQDLKTAFVGEVTRTAETVETNAQNYAGELKKLKDMYIGYLGQSLEQDKKLAKQAKEITKSIIEPEATYTLNFLHFSSIGEATENEAAKALLQYQKVALSLENVQLLTLDTAQTIGGLLNLQTALQASSNDSMKSIGMQIDREVASIVDALSTKLITLQQQALDLDIMLKRINSAEYNIGLASVQEIEKEMTQLQSSLTTLSPKEGLTSEDIEFIKELADYYEDFTAQVKEQLGDVNTQELITLETTDNGLIPYAYADEERGYLESAYDMLSTAGQKTWSGTKTLAKFGWEGTKATYNGAKQLTGVTLDTLAATTKSAGDVIYGAANGNSIRDITDEIDNNFRQIGKNYKEGKSGSAVLKQANEYFENAEKLGGDISSGAVEKTLGKGWTSWLAGHAGKITVNMFTSMGKGISRVADTQATTGEIIEGSLDIGLSFIGGSKVIVSGSQFLKGAKEGVSLFGKKGINFLGKMINNADIKTLKGLSAELLSKTKLTPAEINKLISNSLGIEMKEILGKELIETGKSLDQEFIRLLKEAGKTVTSNLTGEAKEAFEQFVKQQFTNSISGLKEAVLNVLGKSASEYFDNLIENKVSDLIKETIKNYVDKGIIPGVVTAPALEQLTGEWDAGEFTLNTVEVNEELRTQMEEEGCDIDELEKQKGKKQTMKISLSPTSESGGNMTLIMSDGKSEVIPFTYEDGTIKADLKRTEEGINMNLNMNIVEENGSFKASGPMTIDYFGGGIKAVADANVSKPVPPPPPPPAPAQ